jgi:hypothetical protein
MTFAQSAYAESERLGAVLHRIHAPRRERILPQQETLKRDLHCIRRSHSYFVVIKADRAAPHPPDTPSPGQISLS